MIQAATGEDIFIIDGEDVSVDERCDLRVFFLLFVYLLDTRLVKSSWLARL